MEIYSTLQIRKLTVAVARPETYSSKVLKSELEPRSSVSKADVYSPCCIPRNTDQLFSPRSSTSPAAHPSLQTVIKCFECKVQTEEMDKSYLTGSHYTTAGFLWRTRDSGFECIWSMFSISFLFISPTLQMSVLTTFSILFRLSPQAPGVGGVSGTELVAMVVSRWSRRNRKYWTGSSPRKASGRKQHLRRGGVQWGGNVLEGSGSGTTKTKALR